MKKVFLLTFIVLSIGKIEAYNYGFNNATAEVIRVCVNVTGRAECRNIPPRSWGEIRIGGWQIGAMLEGVSASLPDGSRGVRFTNLDWVGNITFTVNPGTSLQFQLLPHVVNPERWTN